MTPIFSRSSGAAEMTPTSSSQSLKRTGSSSKIPRDGVSLLVVGTPTSLVSLWSALSTSLPTTKGAICLGAKKAVIQICHLAGVILRHSFGRRTIVYWTDATNRTIGCKFGDSLTATTPRILVGSEQEMEP